MYNGFVRIAAAVPQLRVADCAFNVEQIISLAKQAEDERVQVVCFPELCITGYTCGDLFHQQKLLEEAEKALSRLSFATFMLTTALIVGMPVRAGGRLYNAAVVLQGGHVLGVVPKTHIPNHHEFYEGRWFASGASVPDVVTVDGHTVPFGTRLLFTDGAFTFGIELCEDLWTAIPPSSQHALHGAEVLFNLSASNELVGKQAYRRQLVEQQSARCRAAYVYASAGVGESTTDLVFAGNALIAENGTLLQQSVRFSREPQLVVADVDVERLQSERLHNPGFAQGCSPDGYQTVAIEEAHYKAFDLRRTIGKHPFIPSDAKRDEHCADLLAIQATGLAKRWQHARAQTVVVGVSGGLDSTLALLVCARAADLLGYDRRRITGITMPGFGTTGRTYDNALGLMRSLGITVREISIKDACLQHFKDIAHDPEVHDVTYENAQARERTQVLMDVANQENGLVVGTGDLSELALGWATYNGDHMSMYGVNSGVPKTLVRYLVDWIADREGGDTGRILKDVLDTPVSPELLPADAEGNIAQKTEDLVGPYELHDFFLYYLVRHGFTPEKILFLAKEAFKDDYSTDEIRKWLATFLRRFFAQQFKRSCMPDGPKVGSVSLSPRGDWRMPSDAVAFVL